MSAQKRIEAAIQTLFETLDEIGQEDGDLSRREWLASVRGDLYGMVDDYDDHTADSWDPSNRGSEPQSAFYRGDL